MLNFVKRKPPEEPQAPKTTGAALKGDVVKTTSGTGKIIGGAYDIASGAVGAAWHTYTSVFNPKARNIIGATAAASFIGYSVAQEELGTPSLGDIYKSAKNGTCLIIPEVVEPAYCSEDELSSIDSAVLEAPQNG